MNPEYDDTDDDVDMTDAERIDWHDYLDEAKRERVDDEDERFPGWRHASAWTSRYASAT